MGEVPINGTSRGNPSGSAAVGDLNPKPQTELPKPHAARSHASAERVVYEIAICMAMIGDTPAQPRRAYPFLPAYLWLPLGIVFWRKGGAKLRAVGSHACSENRPPW